MVTRWGIAVKIMHNDFGNRTKREEFRYHYKGSELLPYAERASCATSGPKSRPASAPQRCSTT
jgi:hypothetical protein